MEVTDRASLISVIEVSEREAEYGNEVQRRGTKRELGVKLKSMSRAIRNWRKCLACGERKQLHRPSKEMRSFFCKTKKVYIQKNDRVCNYHTQREHWNEIHFKTSTNFSGAIIDEMVSLLLNPVKNSVPPINVGLTDMEFSQIIHDLGIPQNPNKREEKMIMAVRLYIERLRHGHTQGLSVRL